MLDRLVLCKRWRGSTCSVVDEMEGIDVLAELPLRVPGSEQDSTIPVNGRMHNRDWSDEKERQLSIPTRTREGVRITGLRINKSHRKGMV